MSDHPAPLLPPMNFIDAYAASFSAADMAALSRAMPNVGMLEAGHLELAPDLDQFFPGSRVFRRASDAGGFNVHQFVDVVVPDFVVGDAVPDHLFYAPLPEPLPPILRADRAPAGSLLSALQDFDADDRFFDDLHGSAAPRSLLASAWAAHHEWIIAGAFILGALAVALFKG